MSSENLGERVVHKMEGRVFSNRPQHYAIVNLLGTSP